MLTAPPRSDLDLYTEDSIVSPYESYRVLRELGPAVRLDRYDVWALARYADVHAALRDHRTFSSGSGVAMNDPTNAVMRGTLVASDPPHHDRFRSLVNQPLTPKALRAHHELFDRRADELVDRLLGAGTFDTVTDFAQVFPLSVVPDLVGWPAGERENFLTWSCAAFDTSGPLNERTVAAQPVMGAMSAYVDTVLRSGGLRPGSWGADLVAAAEAGQVEEHRIPSLLGAFLAPSVDTTISMLSSALWLLGRDPALWQEIRRDHTLIPNALDEVVRYETPVRAFTRLVTRDHEVGGTTLPAGSRVLLLYGAANRDDRKWEAPDVFDIRRPDAKHHLGFGHGIHSCVGQGLARLEGAALFAALARRVRRIEVGEPTWRVNNTMRAIAGLPASLRA
jgi:cytochrome P450